MRTTQPNLSGRKDSTNGSIPVFQDVLEEYMNPAPALSLAENVANKIKQMILSGSLVNVLPGERELGNRLSVGRETVRKALTILEKENWIAPARIKVPRRILKAAADNMGPDASSFPIQEKKATIGFLTSQPIKRLAQSVLVEAIYHPENSGGGRNQRAHL